VTGYRLRFLHVDTASQRTRVHEEPLGGDTLGPLDYGVLLHLRRGAWRSPPLDPANVLVIGSGVFAGSPLYGSHRLVAVFRSPVSRGLHASALGGAAYVFARTGPHGVVVEGWSEEPLALVIDATSGKPEAWLEELGWDRLWEIWRGGYRGHRGTRALALYLRRLGCSQAREPRSLVTGPAAARTLAGGIFSPRYRGDGLDPAAFDSAARGGGGSVMLRAHGLAGVIFCGGLDPSEENPRLRDRGLLDRVSRERLGRPFHQAVLEATTKYRYDPRLGTGGTFGVNYVHYRTLIPMLGYNTVYLSQAAREKLLSLVLERLWRPVQEEAIEKRSWGTCGEPCPAACKKVYRGTKVDYEPSNALGPFIGVFDAEETRRLIDLADDLGIDAIEAGHLVAWLLDLLGRGMLHPGELGLEERPSLDPLRAMEDPEAVTRTNAEAARRILEGLVEQRSWLLTLVATRGLRAAAKALNASLAGRVAMHHTGFHDPAVYAAHGDRGYMTPNLYWSPGVVAPMPVLGRYWTVYSPGFDEPEAMAETAAHRAVNEYLVDNAGFCRFHRKWAEKLLEDLYREIWDVEADLAAHAARMLLLIDEYQSRAGAEPRPWESRKTVDMVASIAAETGAHEWAARLATDPAAAEEWWTRFHRHSRRVLAKLAKAEREPAKPAPTAQNR
jgi:glyceraldehyde-3-phosphate dehydrogenase (ferredoxin)